MKIDDAVEHSNDISSAKETLMNVKINNSHLLELNQEQGKYKQYISCDAQKYGNARKGLDKE